MNSSQWQATLDLHGDEGSINTEWFTATAPVRLCVNGDRYRRVPHLREPAGTGRWHVDWASGVVGLWRGLRAKEAHPTSGAHAAHVVEVMESVHIAMREGRAVTLASSFPAPSPMDWAR
jgi:hypothetical protein